MNTSIGPDDDLSNSSYFKTVCNFSGQFFGRIWTIISDIPHQFYQLISSIKEISAKSLFSSKPNKTNSSTALSSKKVQESEESDLELEFDLDNLCFGVSGNLKITKTSPPSILTPNKIGKTEIDSETEDDVEDDTDDDEDPLDNMGAVNANVDFEGTSLINPVKEETAIKFTEEEVEKNILTCIKEIIQPARKLLLESKHIKEFDWNTCLSFLERLDLELDGLKIYTSKFIDMPQGHLIMQGAMDALAKKRVAIENKLCVQIKIHYMPNSAILEDGHCLFWSINDLLQNEESPIYYRKLAAEYIRKNTNKFDSAVKDVVKLPLIRESISAYTESQGGLQNCCDKLEKKLNRPFTEIDFYCDCLENTNLWGGNTEVLALSEQLQVQILIFTQQPNSTWRFDAREGCGKFNDKPPLLLYYNGSNHYQSLIPRK